MEQFSADVTIVSVFPFPINEEKPGIIPRYYHIPAAKQNDIELLVVSPGVMYIDLVDRKEKLVVDVSAPQIANSILRDFVSSQLAFTEDGAPGLFILSGRVTDKALIRKNHSTEIERALAKQNNWFRQLVYLADDDWSKYHQHRLISNLQREAARRLGLEREWLVDVVTPKACPACGVKLPNPEVVICSACGCILDEKRAAAFKFAVK